MMTPSLLREAGEALYGARWQSGLARDLNVSDRTVRRWAAGDFDIPENVWTELAHLVRERRKVLTEIGRKLPR